MQQQGTRYLVMKACDDKVERFKFYSGSEWYLANKNFVVFSLTVNFRSNGESKKNDLSHHS